MLLTPEALKIAAKYSIPAKNGQYELRNCDGMSEYERSVLLHIDDWSFDQSDEHFFTNYQLLQILYLQMKKEIF